MSQERTLFQLPAQLGTMVDDIVKEGQSYAILSMSFPREFPIIRPAYLRLPNIRYQTHYSAIVLPYKHNTIRFESLDAFEMLNYHLTSKLSEAAKNLEISLDISKAWAVERFLADQLVGFADMYPAVRRVEIEMLWGTQNDHEGLRQTTAAGLVEDAAWTAVKKLKDWVNAENDVMVQIAFGMA